MRNFIKNAIISLKSRVSGKIDEDIKNTNNVLKIIDTLDATDNFWLSWYLSYYDLEGYLKFLKKLRFFPGRFIPKKDKDTHVREVLEKITIDNKLIIKDIVLPIPNINDSEDLLIMIIEGLLSYLLDGIDDELFHSLVRLKPYLDGPYEYKSVQLEKDDIVIDAGANIGEFSALAGVKGCKVYAFEPMPFIIEKYLSKTAEWNPNITICNYALSDKQGELVFYEGDHIGSSSFVKTRDSNKIKVQSIDLDTWVEENKIPSVDFLKADIEGAERYMLMGAKCVLKEFAPKIAICTYHLPDDPKVLRELILDTNPNYIIEERWKKIYAYVPKK